MALAWPNHVHHGPATAWFDAEHDAGWATSPATEAGFVRVSSNTRAVPDARSPAEAIDLLARVRDLPGHTFWEDSVSPADPEPGAFRRVVGYRQVTDAHLLALAHRHDGALATFDRGVVELAGAELAGRVELLTRS